MLTAKLVPCRPLSIIGELKKLKIPYEELFNIQKSEAKIRIDLKNLNKTQKLNLCKIVGIPHSEIKRSDLLIFY